MKKLNLAVRYPKRFKVTTDGRHSLQVEPDLLNRGFNPEHPNQVWTTDLSYIWTNEGWIIAEHMKTILCIQALQMA